MNSILNKIVSCYQCANSTTPPKPVNLLVWLNSQKYRTIVELIRSQEKEAIKKAFKKTVPGITVSGLFDGKTPDTLRQYSSLIAIDIDNVQNVDRAKHILMSLPYVAYLGLSISGKGLFCVIPLSENADNFLYHFLSIKEEFEGYGLKIDESCKDITRFRFYSVDDNAYFNHNASAYTAIKIPEVKTISANLVGVDATYNRVNEQIGILEGRGVDICESYNDWIKLGAAFYSEFGENGFVFFKRISFLRPIDSQAANEKKVKEQWNKCLKMKRVNISTFFYLSKKYI